MIASATPVPSSSPSWPRSALRASAVAVVVLIQLFLAGWIVPRFNAIFHDMIGDRPLPLLTTIVIHGRWIMAAVACACCAAALLRRDKSKTWIFAMLAIVILQVVVTLVALFMPLNVIIKQLSGTA